MLNKNGIPKKGKNDGSFKMHLIKDSVIIHPQYSSYNDSKCGYDIAFALVELEDNI